MRNKLIDAIELTDPEQIANLPWVGNYAADAPLFEKIEAFEYRLLAATVKTSAGWPT